MFSAQLCSEIMRSGRQLLAHAVPPRLVSEIERLVDHPALGRRLGVASRERVERLYSLRALTPRFAQKLWKARRAD